MLSAHQIIMKSSFRDSAFQMGLREALGFRGPIFFDSGGFLSQKLGSCAVSADQVLAVYEDLKPDIAAVLDMPLSPLLPSATNRHRWKITLSNTEYMRARSSSIEIVPVIHAYNSSYLDKRHEELKRIVGDPSFLCVGSFVPLLRGSYVGSRFSDKRNGGSSIFQRWRLMAQLLCRIRSLYPNTILHVFGVGSVSTMLLLFLLGVDSVDSVGWRLKAAYGEIQLGGLSNRTLNPTPLQTRRRRALSMLDRDLLADCSCPSCVSLPASKREGALKRSYADRAIHNAFVMVSELIAFRSAAKLGSAVDHVRVALKHNAQYARILDDVILPHMEGHSSGSTWEVR
jgi:7-cyano-7-deazaguanine tRNA-ribosyltransferase